jgi:uncharacterized Zn-binding protein involved in type VI secretion
MMRVDPGGSTRAGNQFRKGRPMIVARVGDKHACPRHGPNVIIEGGSGTVDGRAIARVGDKCACGGVILEGKSGAVLDGRPIAYLGSKTSCGGVIVECAGTATFV